MLHPSPLPTLTRKIIPLQTRSSLRTGGSLSSVSDNNHPSPFHHHTQATRSHTHTHAIFQQSVYTLPHRTQIAFSLPSVSSHSHALSQLQLHTPVFARKNRAFSLPHFNATVRLSLGQHQESHADDIHGEKPGFLGRDRWENESREIREASQPLFFGPKTESLNRGRRCDENERDKTARERDIKKEGEEATGVHAKTVSCHLGKNYLLSPKFAEIMFWDFGILGYFTSIEICIFGFVCRVQKWNPYCVT